MVDALRKEWRQHPPVHHLVAGYLGYKAPLDEPLEQVSDLSDLEQTFGALPIAPAFVIDTSLFDNRHKTEVNHV